jgi:hypothetical protein
MELWMALIEHLQMAIIRLEGPGRMGIQEHVSQRIRRHHHLRLQGNPAGRGSDAVACRAEGISKEAQGIYRFRKTILSFQCLDLKAVSYRHKAIWKLALVVFELFFNIDELSIKLIFLRLARIMEIFV